MKKSELLLFAAPIVVLIVPLLSSVVLPELRRYPNPDELDTMLLQYTGKDSINCGIVDVKGPNRAATDKCAVAAFKSGKPFRVRYDNLGQDAPESTGIYRTIYNEVAIIKFYPILQHLNTPAFGVEWAEGQQGCSTSAIASPAESHLRSRRIAFGWLRCN